MCVKIDKFQNIERRPFIILGDSVFDDFIVSDYKKCPLVFESAIHFDKTHPIDPANFSD